MLVFDLEIIREDNGRFLFRVSNASDEAFLWFRPGDKNLEIIPGNGISGILTLHISQIRRLLHNKRLSTFYSGFRIRFCIQALKDVPAFTDRKRIIALDRRGGNHFIYPQEESPASLTEIFCDGSLVQETGAAAIAIVIKSAVGKYRLETFEVNENKSCQLELLAAIQGLKLTSDQESVRIVSDSLYVRKGLTEWIIHWRLNNWYTIQGSRVKNRENWIQFDALTENRYVEFQWIKARSGHFEQSLADLYAKDLTRTVS